jgi:hypothetical protein
VGAEGLLSSRATEERDLLTRASSSTGSVALRLATRKQLARCIGVACLLLHGPPAADAQQATPRDWPAQKCELYRKAWQDVLAQRGSAGLGAAFLERNEAFMASGCSTRPDVCPRTPQELDVANILSLKAMNAGITGSFLPFACRNPS